MIQEYLDYLRDVRGLSPCTLEAYAQDLRCWVGYAKGRGLRWSTITERDVDGWLAEMSQQEYKPRTRNRRLSALRGLLNWAYHKGMLEQNAARWCQAAKIDNMLPMGLDLKQIDKYLNERRPTAKSNIVALVVSLMVEAGLRISEATAIRTEDINEREQQIKVIGKGRKERIAMYGDRVKRELEYWGNGANGYILPDFEPRMYREMIESELFPFVGKMHPHQLRHTFATQMINNGMPINSLSLLMGHSRTSTTENYARVAVETIKQQYNQYSH